MSWINQKKKTLTPPLHVLLCWCVPSVFGIFRACWIYSTGTDCWHQKIWFTPNVLDIFRVYCASDLCTLTCLTFLVVLWPCQNCKLWTTCQKSSSSTWTKFFCRKKKKALGKHEHMVGWVFFPAILFSHRKRWSCRTLSVNQLQKCYPGNSSSQNS